MIVIESRTPILKEPRTMREAEIRAKEENEVTR